MAAEELRRRQLAALTNWVMAGAKVQPVVLAFEDLHWADPTTLDVLRGIAERGALAPLFILATTRPEFRPPWSMRSHHGTDLARAARPRPGARHGGGIVRPPRAAARGGRGRRRAHRRRAAVRRGSDAASVGARRAGGGIQAIPPTLQQSLMARLDRLGPAREVAQIGSVIGRGFSYGLLRDVAGMEDAPLQAALEKLADADIVLVQGLPPESDYRFKHALIQDAAYENLLKSRRQVLHRRVAEILRDRFADTAAAEPEALAYHFTQAGMTDAAIEWWGKAGDQALRRSAFQEAISHLGKAIEMADKARRESAPRPLPRSAVGRPTAETTDQLRPGGDVVARLCIAEETKAAFSAPSELAGRMRRSAERFATYYGLWVGGLLRGEKARREAAEALLNEARSAQRDGRGGHRPPHLWRDLLGDRAILRDAKRASGEGAALYDPERDRDLPIRFAQDIGVSALSLSCRWCNGCLERPDRARAAMTEALAHAVEVRSRAHAGLHVFACGVVRNDPPRSGPPAATAETALAARREHGMKL